MRDLEIYIRDTDLAAATAWLSDHIDELEVSARSLGDKPVKGQGFYRGCRIRVSVYPGAGGKRYASLMIEGDELPWASDLEFGRSAWQAMGHEVRCSPGDWKEGEPVEDERWWRIDERGEQLAVWN